MHLFSRSESETWQLFIEIGSGSVVGTIIKQQNTKVDRIWSKRFNVPIKQATAAGDMVKRITITLVELLMETSEIATKANQAAGFSNVYVFYSAPWIYEETITNEISSQDFFTVSQTDLDDLLHSISTSNINNAVVILSQYKPQWLINGYVVQEPTKKQAQTLGVMSRVVAVDARMYRAVQDSIASLYPNTEVNHHSNSMFQKFTIETLSPENSNQYAILHLSYEAISLTVVDAGISSFYSWEGIGINTIVRALALATNKPHEHIMTELLASETIESAKDWPKDTKKVIKNNIKVFFANVKSQITLPKQIFFINHSPVAEPLFLLFADIINEQSVTKHDFIDIYTILPQNTKHDKIDSSVLMMTGFSTNLI